MVEWGMQTLTTLADYRTAIRGAADSQALELLIYRALPALYKDMRMPYTAHSHVSVATKLYRKEDAWEIWFNIEAPNAIAALTHLDPTIFTRLNGGAHQASAIVKGEYGNGFDKTPTPFEPEPVFDKEWEVAARRLNHAKSLDVWWATFYDVLPSSLAQARGWTDPKAAQWKYAKEEVRKFREEYGETLQSHYLLSGTVQNAKTDVRANWGSSAASFSNRIDRHFYPLLSHNPWITLDKSSVHSVNISGFNLQPLSAGLCERAMPIVTSHCGIMGTRSMPAYLLKEAMTKSSDLSVQLPVGLESGPGGF